MPLWNCIGTVEIAIWVFIRIIANKPAYQFLGKVVRDNYMFTFQIFTGKGPIRYSREIVWTN